MREEGAGGPLDEDSGERNLPEVQAFCIVHQINRPAKTMTACGIEVAYCDAFGEHTTLVPCQVTCEPCLIMDSTRMQQDVS